MVMPFDSIRELSGSIVRTSILEQMELRYVLHIWRKTALKPSRRCAS